MIDKIHSVSVFSATFQFGVISEVDAVKCMARVHLPNLDNLETQFLQVLQFKTLKDKHYHLPDIGEHVVVILDERGEDGVILGAVYSDEDKPPVNSGNKHHVQFSDGSSVDFDRSTGTFYADFKGPVTINAGSDVVIKAPKVTLDTNEVCCTGQLIVNGLLTYQGGLTGSGGGNTTAKISGNIQVTGGDISSDGIHLKTHRHQNAGGNGESGEPIA